MGVSAYGRIGTLEYWDRRQTNDAEADRFFRFSGPYATPKLPEKPGARIPFQGAPRCGYAFPGLKPWAESSCPFGFGAFQYSTTPTLQSDRALLG
jgi:hypothetical protein